MNPQGMLPYGYMMTPWQQMQQMYQLQSTMMEEQKRLIMKEESILIIKFFFVHEGENRRVKVDKTTDYNGLFKFMKHFLAPYHKIKGLRIDRMQYQDEDKEWMNFNCQKEWSDCLRISEEIRKSNIIKIKVFTVKPKKQSKIEEIVIKEEVEGEEEENEGELEIINAPRSRKETDEERKEREYDESFESPPQEEYPIPELVELGQEKPLVPIPAPQYPTVMSSNPPFVEDENSISSSKPISIPKKDPVPSHFHRCDICKTIPIRGKLFSSTNRADFDLCETCFHIRGNYGLRNEEFDVFLQPGRKIDHIGPTNSPINQVIITKKKEEEEEAESVTPLVREQDPVRKEQNEYQREVFVLRDMGFHDLEKSRGYLRKNGGDIQAVVREYLAD